MVVVRGMSLCLSVGCMCHWLSFFVCLLLFVCVGVCVVGCCLLCFVCGHMLCVVMGCLLCVAFCWLLLLYVVGCVWFVVVVFRCCRFRLFVLVVGVDVCCLQFLVVSYLFLFCVVVVVACRALLLLFFVLMLCVVWCCFIDCCCSVLMLFVIGLCGRWLLVVVWFGGLLCC